VVEHPEPAVDRVVIVIMAKTPVEGLVKTRLAAVVGDATATEVALALLADTLANALEVADRVIVSTVGDLPRMADLLPVGVAVHAQEGADFADRLAHAQRTAFEGGAARVVLLGADCPTVDPQLIRHAIAELDRSEAVLGPADDGGYTLLATSRPTPELFAGITMGQPDVGKLTVEAAVQHGLPLHLVEVRHDLDHLSDFAAALSAGQLDHAPRTRAMAISMLDDAAS
jgi:uncharacterized protein